MTSSLSTPRPADRFAGAHASGPREQALLRRCSPPAPGPGRNTGRARIGSTGCLLLAVMAAAPAVAGGPSSPGRAAPWQAEAPVPAVSGRVAGPKHLEYDAAMERLEEALPAGWRTEWLDRLRLAFADEAVEVHATNTHSHGDVRVRALDLKRKRNVFTMAWRPSDGKFTCRILLNTEQVAACPGVERLSTSQSDPLKTGFIFDASQDQERALAGAPLGGRCYRGRRRLTATYGIGRRGTP